MKRLVIAACALVALLSVAGVSVVSVRAFVSQDLLAAGGSAAGVAGVVVAVIAGAAVLLFVLGRVLSGIGRRAVVTPMAAGAPAVSVPRVRPSKATQPSRPAQPLSFGARKVIGAFVLFGMVFTSTLAAFGRVEIAVGVSTVLTAIAFGAYDTLDTSLDNCLGVVLAGFAAVALAMLLVPLGGIIADAAGTSPTPEAVLMWAVSIPAAMGVHMLIVCAGRAHIRAGADVPARKRGLVFTVVVLGVIAIAIAIALASDVAS